MQHNALYGDKPGPADGKISRAQDFHFDNQNVGGRSLAARMGPWLRFTLKNTHANEVFK
jgi:hypothetical protein